MQNKKLGITIVILSLVAGILVFNLIRVLGRETNNLQCYPTNECQRMSSLLGLTHVAIGLISFILALGFYLLFFSTSEEAILKRLEEEKNMKIGEDRFGLILKAMDDHERMVMKVIKEQEGVSQSTLRYKANLSKAKISQILTSFEKKHLIKREARGKTYSVYLVDNF